jgi:hypothetical protein
MKERAEAWEVGVEAERNIVELIAGTAVAEVDNCSVQIHLCMLLLRVAYTPLNCDLGYHNYHSHPGSD